MVLPGGLENVGNLGKLATPILPLKTAVHRKICPNFGGKSFPWSIAVGVIPLKYQHPMVIIKPLWRTICIPSSFPEAGQVK